MNSSPTVAAALRFTGARFLLGVHGPISYEYRHRYGAVAPRARGKRVLDAARRRTGD